MGSKPKSGPQDLPPKGGYNPIQTSRVAIKRILNPTLTTGLFIASTMVGGASYFFAYRRMQRDNIELKSAQLAILPLLTAERDRNFLKQIRRNRDEEADLMKDYPGWEVGTYFGERIFNNEPEDKFISPIYPEYIAQADANETCERYFRFQLT